MRRYSRYRPARRSQFLGLWALASLSITGALHAQDTEPQYDLVRTVHILDEPRHRTVYKDGAIRLLDVQINPGDKSLPHTHDFAILYTYFNLGDKPEYGRIGGNTDYAKEPYTHRVKNDGPDLFRIIAMGNTGEPMPEDAHDEPFGMEVEAQLENPWFRSYRYELAPGHSTAVQSHINPSVVIQATPGLIHVSREDGITAELSDMAQWAWREAGSTYSVSNMGTQTVSFVINEGRRQP
ncbi:MAG: hypothetical protein R3332_03175 [Pseudohongiellaceae bacterium]|nr:hypothetical protein [Pseudohongiellaceae bacterium]